MSIRRAPRKKTYTNVDNAVFNAGLSYRAMGLLCFLLSKPDHWEVSTTHLINSTQKSANPVGKDAIYSILKELKEAGFVTAEQLRKESGKMGKMDYIIHDTPQRAQPHTDKPDTAQPLTANPPQVNTEREVNTDKQVNTDDGDDAREYVTSPDDPLFDVGQPKPTRFKIALDWRPDQSVLVRYCNNAGCQIVNRPDWLMNEIIGEWVNYWHAEGSMQSESKWYAKLSAWIKRKLADHDSQPTKRTRKSGEPGKTDYRSDTCGMELAN